MMQSTPNKALKAKTKHTWRRGVGFIRADAALPKGPFTGRACVAPAPIADQSEHMLEAPGGQRMRFKWIEAERAWERWGGHRLAFTAAHLGEHGWLYFGPA